MVFKWSLNINCCKLSIKIYTNLPFYLIFKIFLKLYIFTYYFLCINSFSLNPLFYLWKLTKQLPKKNILQWIFSKIFLSFTPTTSPPPVLQNYWCKTLLKTLYRYIRRIWKLSYLRTTILLEKLRSHFVNKRFSLR